MTEKSDSNEAKHQKIVKKTLLAGYWEAMRRSPRLSDGLHEMETPENAIFWLIDDETQKIPNEIQWDQIKSKISGDHQTRIENIWEKILEHKRKLKATTHELKECWEKCPCEDAIPDQAESMDILTKSQVTFQKKYANVLVAVMAEDPLSNERNFQILDQSKEIPSLTTWKTREKNARRAVFEAYKVWATTLEAYYLLLLEPPKEPNQSPVLAVRDSKEASKNPKTDELKALIVDQALKLFAVDVTRQTTAIAKAQHHEQPTEPLRKIGAIPYFYHEIDTMRWVLFDVLPELKPRTLEEFVKARNFICILIVVTGLHDLIEDTKTTVADIITLIDRLITKYDTRIDQKIESGFGRSSEELKKSLLDPFGGEVGREVIKNVLRIVSENIQLDPDEKRLAIKKKYLGKERTEELLEIKKNIWDRILKALNNLLEKEASGGPSDEKKGLNKEEKRALDKIDKMLIKNSIFSDFTQAVTLIVKLEDRAHNIETIDGKKSDGEPLYSEYKQRAILRASMRLLKAASQFIEEVQLFEKFLSKPIERCVAVIIEKYTHLESPIKTTLDEKNIKKLIEWNEGKFRPRPLEGQFKTYLEKWESEKTNAKKEGATTPES